VNADLGIGAGAAARLVAEALDTPIVLIDIGCRDGIHPRWDVLGDRLHVYGYDATVLEPSTPNRHYRQLAIGDRDGECSLEIPSNAYEARVSPIGVHKMPMAKLDTLWAEGLPLADFIKIDVEGHEPQVLAGARNYLAASNLIGAEVETNFFISPPLPDTHFRAVSEPMLRERLLVMDLAIDRPGPDAPWIRPGTCNALFCRDLAAERETASSYPYRAAEAEPAVETILKTIAILDVYGLPVPAAHVVRTLADRLRSRIDPNVLLAALMPPPSKQVLTRFAGALKRRLPHLGLGIWSRLARR
jgi:FkbM family methyltransferase